MKKFLLLLAFVSLMVGQGFGQCPVSPCISAPDKWINRVRICKYQDDGYKFKLSETAVVSKTVAFEFTGLPMIGLSIDFGDGAGFVAVTTNMLTINYPSIGQKTIRIPDVSGLGYIDKLLLIKDPIKPYKKPDQIWHITTTNNFDPISTGAKSSFFSASLNQQGVMSVSKGEGRAYVRFGKNHNNKIVRPIIYVDGIDFDSEDKNFFDPALGSGNTDNNVIRHGANTS